MVPANQLVGDSWYVHCAACCRVALVFVIMHLHTLFILFICSSFKYFSKKGKLEGTNFEHVFGVCVCVFCFILCRDRF